jgi:hypothetical protein
VQIMMIIAPQVVKIAVAIIMVRAKDYIGAA